MKKLILKFFGFDKVQLLKIEIENLQTTVSQLKAEATEVYKKTEDAFIIINHFDIDRNNEMWWEGDKIHELDPRLYDLAYQIQKNARKEWIKKHPSLKVHKIFHGGCLGCVTPVENGIGICLDCKYCGGNKDLSKTITQQP